LKTKEDILENDGGNQTVIAIDWLPYCFYFTYLLWKSTSAINCWVTSHPLLCSTEDRKSHRFGTTWEQVKELSL